MPSATRRSSAVVGDEFISDTSLRDASASLGNRLDDSIEGREKRVPRAAAPVDRWREKAPAAFRDEVHRRLAIASKPNVTDCIPPESIPKTARHCRLPTA